MPLPLLALIPIVISVAGRTFVTMAAKKVAKGYIKKGFKKLTKKNFKKSYDFFKGENLLNLADKNKVLKNLKIRIPKPKIDKEAVAKGAELVKDITKPGKISKVLTQTRELLLPGLKKRSLIQYPAYAAGIDYVLDRKEKVTKAEEKSLKKQKKQTEIEEKKELHETKKKETSLGEIDLNILADKEHTWKTNAQGDYITE